MKPRKAAEQPAENGGQRDRAQANSPAPSAKAGRRSTPRPLDAHDHDLMTTATGSGRLKIFVDLVRAAGLTDWLRGAGPFTVFAPTDRAFDRMSERDLDALRSDGTRLAELLRHHVVAGRVRAPQPEQPRVATAIDGVDLTLTSRVDAYYVNDARLVRTNIRASNGVIHAIDKLLLSAPTPA